MKAVRNPQTKRVKLEEWDPEGDTWIVIREGRVGQSALRDAELLRVMVEHSAATSREVFDLSNGARIITECWLTFVDSNLPYEIVAEDGQVLDTKPMFHQGMSEREFRAAFTQLPVPLALEWHQAVLALNPAWQMRED